MRLGMSDGVGDGLLADAKQRVVDAQRHLFRLAPHRHFNGNRAALDNCVRRMFQSLRQPHQFEIVGAQSRNVAPCLLVAKANKVHGRFQLRADGTARVDIRG